MVAIGGKSRKAKMPQQPQLVVQLAEGLNQYAVIELNDQHQTVISWIGDPNAATKFNSKYEAKSRVRELVDVPATRVFHTIINK